MMLNVTSHNHRLQRFPLCGRLRHGRHAIVGATILSCLLLAVATLPTGRAAAQNAPVPQSQSGSPVYDSPSKAPADVVIIVKPLSADVASIGIAYNRRISHALVRAHLAKLSALTGWMPAGDLQVSDASVHPEHLKQYPLTTAAMVTLYQAPQVYQNAPVLRPYLQAYQTFGHVEVLFAIGALNPYNGVTRFDSKALSVELEQDAGQGVYRYDTTIRDHTGELPALVVPSVTAPISTPVLPARVGPEGRHFGMLPGLLAAAGLILLAGAGAYWTLLKRAPKVMPARTPLRR